MSNKLLTDSISYVKKKVEDYAKQERIKSKNAEYDNKNSFKRLSTAKNRANSIKNNNINNINEEFNEGVTNNLDIIAENSDQFLNNSSIEKQKSYYNNLNNSKDINLVNSPIECVKIDTMSTVEQKLENLMEDINTNKINNIKNANLKNSNNNDVSY